MATYLDTSARDTLLLATSQLFGYNKVGAYAGATYPPAAASVTPLSPFDKGTAATTVNGLNGTFTFTAALTKDAVNSSAA